MRQPRTRIAAPRTKKLAAIHRSVRGGSRSSCGRSGRGSPAIALHHDPHAEALSADSLKARSPGSSPGAQRGGRGTAEGGGGGKPTHRAWERPLHHASHGPPPPLRGGGYPYPPPSSFTAASRSKR